MILGSAILEVVIGMAFVYLMFSVLCSALNEWLAGILKLRAETLRDGIKNLLSDPDAQHLAKDFFAHPLVKGLSPGGKGFPSYIPARTFARVLLDIVSPTQGDQKDLKDIYKEVRDKLANLSGENNDVAKVFTILLNEAGVNPQQIEDTAKALQQLEKTRLNLLDFVGGPGNEIAQIEYAATTLEKIGDLEATLKRTEEAATATLNQAQHNIEAYFNETMERLSGSYKRRAQIYIFGIALIISLLLNVDSIVIANSLATNPTLRASIVTLAEGYKQVPDTKTDPLTTVTSLHEQIDQLGLPIGWRELPKGANLWMLKLLGLLVTTFAVAQGAPFWFELLGKLINVRMTGKKPEVPEGQKA
jgi:hypothetical protein